MSVSRIIKVVLIVVIAVLLRRGLYSSSLWVNHGQNLAWGWAGPNQSKFIPPNAVCDRSHESYGFPLTETRPDEELCASDTNNLALTINYLIFIGLAMAVVLGSWQTARFIKRVNE